MRRWGWVVAVAMVMLGLAGCAPVLRSGLEVTIVATPTQGGAPLTVTFLAAVHGGTEPYSVHWDFGDGHTGEGLKAVHEYAEFGLYTVWCRVEDAAGEVAEDSEMIVVEEGPPVVDFAWDPQSPVGWEPVRFEADAYDPDGGSVRVTWDFGDGSVGHGKVATHRFRGPGCGSGSPEFLSYDVSCTAEDDEGNEATVTHTVLVYKSCD